MSPGWVGFIVGAFVGANGGVILMGALISSGKRNECRTCALSRENAGLARQERARQPTDKE